MDRDKRKHCWIYFNKYEKYLLAESIRYYMFDCGHNEYDALKRVLQRIEKR